MSSFSGSMASRGRLRAAVRRFTLGSGPLKRRSDRVQLSARLLVVLAFLVAPSLAVLAATKTTTHLEALAAAQAAERHRVTAVVLGDSPRLRTAPSGAAPTTLVSRVRTRVGWTTPAGVPREGVVLVAPDTPAGTLVPVWVDREGDLTRPPLDRDGIQATATAMGMLPLIGVPIVAWTCYGLLCAALDARRDRRGADGWAAVEPRWRAQLP
jgi:hypothetical protein